MYWDSGNPMGRMAQYKLYMKEILEQAINSFPDLGYDPVEKRHETKKIA